MKRLTFIVLSWIVLSPTLAQAAESNLALLEQAALRSAVDQVADSVVQIRTIGGLDRIGKTTLSQGPTTGLIVSADGYIVSSAFNFAGQPTSILVRLASGEQLAAELVARDLSRMLVLLKVEASSSLPVPEVSALDELQVGQWAVAVGRTFQAQEVGVSVGIVSALNRMYGRVVQTDANTSVANYGGPLVDISGRVIGVLVPMAPSASGSAEQAELAGANFYDSGIGFAVPLGHVLSILERWKQGEDLLPGKLGIGMTKGDAHTAPPVITSVWPNSPAAKADWQPQDKIIAVAGTKVSTQAQLRFQIVPHYAGDTVSVTLRRGEEELESSVTLTGELAPYRHAFLGILPSRKTDAKATPGLAIRGIWPESPAAKADLSAEDRLLKINETKIDGKETAWKALQAFHPEQEVEITTVRDKQERVLKVVLSDLPEGILDTAPQPAEEASENAAAAIELKELKLPQYSLHAKYYRPEVNDKHSVGMLLWLTEADDQGIVTQAEAWQEICQRDRLALIFARPQDTNAGWQAEDLAYLKQLSLAAQQKLTIDSQRIAIGGRAKSGQTALAVAIKQRSFFSGVVAVDAPLPRTLKLPDNSPASRLAPLLIETVNSSFAPLIRRDLKQLLEAKYPTSWIQRLANDDQLSQVTRDTIARWLDGLDRL